LVGESYGVKVYLCAVRARWTLFLSDGSRIVRYTDHPTQWDALLAARRYVEARQLARQRQLYLFEDVSEDGSEDGGSA
jgi:hypothetical protein